MLMQIFGLHGVSLPILLDHLRKEGEVITIGTETGVLENKRYQHIIAQVPARLHSHKDASCLKASSNLHCVLQGHVVPRSKRKSHPHLKAKLS